MTRTISGRGRAGLIGLVLALTLASGPHTMQAQVAPAADVAFAQISETDVRGWLTYLSSDLMQGRQVFTEGYGLAASYIAGELKAMGVKPLGDNGTYLQAVTQRSYHVTQRSSITIDVGGEWGKIGFDLCYEIIFSGHVVDQRNRPEFIFNPSNDAWFGSWGPPQHLAQARLRAAEEGLPVLRATPR